MSIVIQINPLLETKLREKAVTKGVGLNQFISQFLEHSFGNELSLQPSVTEREAVLLQKINLDITSEKWEVYLKLKEKRQETNITQAELKQLIHLTNEIESANAKRIAVLAELAQIRNIPIRVLMEQLGIATHNE